MVLLAAVLWGTLGPCFAWLGQQGVSAPQVAVWRSGVATLVLGLGVLPRGLRLVPRHLPFFAAYGLVSVAVFFVVYTWAIQRCGVAIGVTLLYTAPAWVALMGALFLQEQLSRSKLAALALTFVGAALVAGVHDPLAMRANLPGLAAGLASGLTYATLGIFGRKAFAMGYRPAQTMLFTLAFGGLFLLAFYGPPPPPPEGALPVLLYAGLVPTALSFLLYTAGLERLGDAGRASLLATVEPVVGMILGYAVLHQAVSPTQVAGAACIVGGMMVLR